MTPGPWVRERARRAPADVALVADGRRLGWAELAAEVEDLAAGLAEAAVRPGDRVALRLAGGPFVIALHAIWRLGATAVPLNLRLVERELEAQLARVNPRLLLADSRELAALRARARRSIPAARPVDAAACALVVFTSGSAGDPKAACLSFGNLEASAAASAHRLRSRPEDRWLACLPLYHVGGLSILTRSSRSGAAVVVHEGFDAGRVSDALDAEGITHVSLVPTTLARLLEARAARPAPRTLRAVLLGGAAAPPALVERARARGFPVLPTYGLTEACSQVATAVLGAEYRGGVGPPLAGIRVRIADSDGRPCAAQQVGEIQVSGPMVFPGYLDDPAATAAALRDGWLHTGDLGALDAEGVLHVVDRRTDLVVTGGENVSPAEVEAVLLEHPGVEEAAVSGRPDRDLGQRVVAWIVARPGADLEARALRAHCGARIAGYKVPREFRFVRGLPRNAMGKLVRAALDAEAGRAAAVRSGAPPAAQGRS